MSPQDPLAPARAWVAGTAAEPADAAACLALAWSLKALCDQAWNTDPRATGAIAAACLRLAAGAPAEAAATVAAVARWLHGVAALTRGAMNEAALAFEDAHAALQRAGRPAEAAQVLVPLIVALSVLGRHTQALACGRAALAALQAPADRRAAAKVRLNLANLDVRVGAYADALDDYRRAAVEFARLGDREHSVMADLGAADARAALGLGVLALAAAPAAAATAPAAVPGEIVFKLQTSAALPTLLARHRLTLAAQFGARPIYRLRVAAGSEVKKVHEALALEPTVQLAEPDLIHRSPEARKNQPWAIGEASAYTAQCAPQALRWPLAHTRSRGEGMRVAVLDTGVDATHPVLAGRVLPGADLVDGDPMPTEGAASGATYGHGTHVAGLVLAGAPAAMILPLRVLDAEGAGNVWVLAEALLRAVDPDGNPATADGAQVINLSLGTLTRTRLLDAVGTLATCATPAPGNRIEDQSDPGYEADRQRCAVGGGAVIVAAAGNDASASIRRFPAAEGVYGLLSLTASTSAGRVAAFANAGNWIDVAAPGEGLTSTLPDGRFGTWSGTSMAAAVASASAALLRSAEPGLAPRDAVRRLGRSAALLCDGRTRQVDAAAALGLGPASPLACP